MSHHGQRDDRHEERGGIGEVLPEVERALDLVAQGHVTGPQLRHHLQEALGESLGRVLSVMLARRVEQKLCEPAYIGEIMREVIIAYAKADAGQAPRIEINIPKKMRDKLNDSALEDLCQNLQGDRDKLALKSTFSKAGFEYKIHGATVEVSPDSVSELLSEMVNPDLQEIIANVVGKMGKKSSNEKHTNEGNWKDDSPPDRSRDREVIAKGKER